jgi:methylglutaconyl-CoA hydratase
MAEEMMHLGEVTSTVEHGIATLTFYHPKSNSLPGKILAKLAQAIRDAGENSEIKVLILQSRGEGAFCAGASFDELLALKEASDAKEFFSGFARVINAIRTCPKFVIGRVQGKAVGGGVGVACAVDYCFATRQASVKLSELAVGIGPFVVGPAVDRKIGKSAFCDLAIDATSWKTAEWAREKGMYYQLFDDTASMDAAIQTLATKLSQSSPDAMRMLKKTMWEGTEHWEELLSTRAEMSGQLILAPTARGILAGLVQ